MPEYPSSRVPVSFAGVGTGDEELSWGQQSIYRAMVRQDSWLPIGGVSTPTPGTTVDDVADELRYLMSRYQTMRTRLRFTPDGRPRQVVHAAGEITLEVVEAGENDPEQLAAAVLWRYEHTDLDFENEWPVRMAVILRHGVVTHQVSVFCHLVTDQAGGAVMLAELHARESAPVVGPTSLEQARWQQSPAGQRRHRTAQRHWEQLLRALPPPPAATSTDRRDPRVQLAELSSPATLLAVRTIAARLQTDTASIVLTLVAIALADATGSAPVVLRPIVGNRFQPGLATVVANVNQAALCVLDVADRPFDSAVEATRRASMTACKHAYFDPIAMQDLIERVSRERGVDVDVRCFYNDRRTNPAASGPAATPEEIAAALPRTTFSWSTEEAVAGDLLMWFVHDAPDALAFAVRVDTHFLSPADAEACLYAVEAMAVRAAIDPSAHTTASVGAGVR